MSDTKDKPEAKDLPEVTPEITEEERAAYSSHLYRDTTMLDNVKRPALEDPTTIDDTSSANRTSIVQALLVEHGASLQVDGQYGRETRAAVERFQKDNRIKQTGQVNQSTFDKLVKGLLDSK